MRADAVVIKWETCKKLNWGPKGGNEIEVNRPGGKPPPPPHFSSPRRKESVRGRRLLWAGIGFSFEQAGFPSSGRARLESQSFPRSPRHSPLPLLLSTLLRGLAEMYIGGGREETTPLSLGPLSKSHLATQDEHGRTMSPPPLLPYSPLCLPTHSCRRRLQHVSPSASSIILPPTSSPPPTSHSLS